MTDTRDQSSSMAGTTLHAGIAQLDKNGKNFMGWLSAIRTRLRRSTVHGYRLIRFIEGAPYDVPPTGGQLPSPASLNLSNSAASRILDRVSTEARTTDGTIEPSLAGSSNSTSTAQDDAQLQEDAAHRDRSTSLGAHTPATPANPGAPSANYPSRGEMTDYDRYEVAKYTVIDFLCSTVDDTLKLYATEKEPSAFIIYLKGRFRPGDSSTYTALCNKITAAIIPSKTYTHDGVLEYFEYIDALEQDLAVSEGRNFDVSFLLHSAKAALTKLEDFDVRMCLFMWEWEAKGASPDFGQFKTKLLSQLASRKALLESTKAIHRDTSHKRSHDDVKDTTTATANAATTKEAGAKRGGGDQTGSEQDRKRPKRDRKVCNTCTRPGHSADECYVTHPELREAHLVERLAKLRSSKVDKSKDVSICLDQGSVSSMIRAYKTAIIPKNTRPTGWYLDSGASDWFCYERSSMQEYRPFAEAREVVLGNDSTIPAYGSGKIVLFTSLGVRLTVNDVLYTPQMGINLASVRRLTEKGGKVIFGNTCTIILEHSVIAHAALDPAIGLYSLDERTEDGGRELLPSAITPFAAPARQTGQRTGIMPSNKLILWHKRLGHLHFNAVKHILKLNGEQFKESTQKDDTEYICEPCIYGKQTSMPHHNAATNREDKPLRLIHLDVNGPWQTPSLHKRHSDPINGVHSGSTYVLILTDDCTGKMWTRFYSDRASFRNAFIHFVTHAEAAGPSERRVTRIRMDNAKEFIQLAIQEFCQRRGIEIETSAAYAHEQNGVVERAGRTLREMAATMLIESGLPEAFWAEAWRTANYIRDRCPTNRKLPEGVEPTRSLTPMEAWSGKEPEYQHIHPFGCLVYVTVPRERRVKVLSQHRAWKGIFIGYTRTSKQYRVWNLQKRVMTIQRDARVYETVFPARIAYNEYFPYWKRPHDDTVTLEGDEVAQQALTAAEDTEVAIAIDLEARSLDEDLPTDGGEQEPPSWSLQIPKDPNFDPNDYQRMEEVSHEPELHDESNAEGQPEQQTQPELSSKRRTRRAHARLARAATAYEQSHEHEVGPPVEPQTLAQALALPDRAEWLKAVELELSSLKSNTTFMEVPVHNFPTGKRKMGARWVFKHKRDADGNMTYKARLVIKGYEQRWGIHYTETYAPVMNLRTVRFLLALTALLDWELHQLDVKTAFLNADLPIEEQIYMELPPGYTPDDPNAASLLLLKSLYGLKQAPLLWNKDLHRTIIELLPVKLVKSDCDECLYVGKDLIIGVYVDDFLIFSPSMDIIKRTKAALMNKYSIKDMGEAHGFLGLRIVRDRSKRQLFIDQEEYCKAILARFGYNDVTPRLTPLPPSKSLQQDSLLPRLTPAEELLYRSMLGSLMYASQGTRCDLSTAVGMLGRFASCADTGHADAMDHAFRYLSGTVQMGILYDGSSLQFEGYCDSDWAGCQGPEQDRRKSTSGYVWKMCQGAISWSSKLQATVATSSMEAEVIASNHAAKEGIWLRKLLYELRLFLVPDRGDHPIKTTTIFCDNTGAITIASNPGNQQKTKHYEVQWLWIRQCISNKEVILTYVPTASNTADIFTKALPKDDFVRHVRGLGLRSSIDQVA